MVWLHVSFFTPKINNSGRNKSILRRNLVSQDFKRIIWDHIRSTEKLGE